MESMDRALAGEDLSVVFLEADHVIYEKVNGQSLLNQIDYNKCCRRQEKTAFSIKHDSYRVNETIATMVESLMNRGIIVVIYSTREMSTMKKMEESTI